MRALGGRALEGRLIPDVQSEADCSTRGNGGGGVELSRRLVTRRATNFVVLRVRDLRFRLRTFLLSFLFLGCCLFPTEHFLFWCPSFVHV